MSNSLIEAAGHLPLCLHELTRWQKLKIAIVRRSAGLRLDEDLDALLAPLESQLDAPPRLPRIPQNVLTLGKALAVIPKFSGIVYVGIGLGLESEEVDQWVATHGVGTAISDPGFLSGSLSREVALRYGHSMMIRLLSCAGAPIGPVSPDPSEKEVVFQPGERFVIVRAGRQKVPQYKAPLWIVDAEAMYWPTNKPPHWLEEDF